jgi:hypothetical protein
MCDKAEHEAGATPEPRGSLSEASDSTDTSWVNSFVNDSYGSTVSYATPYTLNTAHFGKLIFGLNGQLIGGRLEQRPTSSPPERAKLMPYSAEADIRIRCARCGSFLPVKRSHSPARR